LTQLLPFAKDLFQAFDNIDPTAKRQRAINPSKLLRGMFRLLAGIMILKTGDTPAAVSWLSKQSLLSSLPCSLASALRHQPQAKQRLSTLLVALFSKIKTRKFYPTIPLKLQTPSACCLL
jgi:hypothetical protein